MSRKCFAKTMEKLGMLKFAPSATYIRTLLNCEYYKPSSSVGRLPPPTNTVRGKEDVRFNILACRADTGDIVRVVIEIELCLFHREQIRVKNLDQKKLFTI